MSKLKLIDGELQELSYMLFNAVVTTGEATGYITNNPFILDKKFNIELLGTLGFLENMITVPSELSDAFYQDWQTVAKSSEASLLMNSLLHYLTADSDNQYMPERIMVVPELLIKHVTLVKVIDFTEFVSKLRELMVSVTTLDSNLIARIAAIVPKLDLGINIRDVKSRELALILYAVKGIVPEDADEFMRFLVYKATDEALLIKDRKTITAFEENAKTLTAHLQLYTETFGYKGYKRLAGHFNRQRLLYLAIKRNSPASKTIINKIARLSKQKHIPFIKPAIETLYEKAGEMSEVEIYEIIAKAYTMKLISIHNSYEARNDSKVGFYKIRNGKSYYKARTKSLGATEFVRTQVLINILGKEIIKRVLHNAKVNNISVISSEYMEIALPVSGKQFINNIPNGSSIKTANFEKDVVVGIKWFDVGGKSTDLDLSGNSELSRIGWNSSQRNSAVMYSGDVTKARNGAVELLKFNKDNEVELYTVSVKNFTGGGVVPFKFFVAESDHIAKNVVDETTIRTTLALEVEEGFDLGVYFKGKFIFDKIPTIGNVETIQPAEYYASLHSYLGNKIMINDILNPKVYGDGSNVLDLNNPDKSLLLKLVE